MKLFRPCGLEEALLLFDSDMMAWPPRLPSQPIFYPVTNLEYAAQISRMWNATEGSLMGYVTEFDVSDVHAQRFERKIVGAKMHEELWVPSEELATFNQEMHHLQLVGLYLGTHARGVVPTQGPWRGLGLKEQATWLGSQEPSQFVPLVSSYPHAVWAHWPAWLALGVLPEAMDALRGAWQECRRKIELPEILAMWV